MEQHYTWQVELGAEVPKTEVIALEEQSVSKQDDCKAAC